MSEEGRNETPPSVALARAMLRESLSRETRAALNSRAPTLVILVVPGADAMSSLAAALSARWPRLRMIHVPRPPKAHNVVDKPYLDAPYVVMSPNADWIDPPIVAAADHRNEIRIGPKTVREAIRVVTGDRVAVSQGDVSGLGRDDIVYALRPRSSGAACLARLKRAVVARRGIDGAASSADASAPDLDSLSGFGPALAELRRVAADVERMLAAKGFQRGPSVLMRGPPGTGKTMMASALAQTVGLPILKSSVGAWFPYDAHLGNVIGCARQFFQRAAELGPCVAFLDEIDGLPNRESMDTDRSSWWTPLVNTVLTEIDALRNSGRGVVLVGATNQYEKLDAALKRAGRFDVHVEVLGPTTPDEVAGVLRFHLKHDLVGDDIALIATLASSRKASGAELANFVARARARAEILKRPLELQDLLNEVAPPDCRSSAMRRRTAIHEAAHAVIAHALGFSVPSVSVVAQGRALGHTLVEDGDRETNTRDTIEAHAVVSLAGRAADIHLSGAATANAGHDLTGATRLLTAIHACFGLGEGLVARGDPEEAERLPAFDPALKAQVEIDLRRLMAEAEKLVRRHERAIVALAEHLLVTRVASGADLVRIFDAAAPRGRAPRRPKP